MTGATIISFMMHARKNKNVEIPTCRNIQLLGTQLMLQGLEKDTT